MPEFRISSHDEPPAEARALVDEGLGRFNEEAAPLHEVRPLACFAHDDAGAVVGGAVGRRWGRACELQQLWVAPALRRQGLGGQLVRAFEAQARQHGCDLCYLDTFTFQAPSFYRRLGYSIDAQRAGFPQAILKFHLSRRLGETPPAGPDQNADAPSAPFDPPPVTLREITAELVIPVVRLSVAEEQKGFVATNAISLAQALCAPEAWYRAIYSGDDLAGFVMLEDQTLRQPPPVEPEVFVWRLMVDQRFQGRGIGRAAMQQVISHVRAKAVVPVLHVSYVPGPGCPEPFYRGLGFLPTGRMEGIEVILALPLSAVAPPAPPPSSTPAAP